MLDDSVFAYCVQLLLTRQPVLWSYTGLQNFCALWGLHCLFVNFIMTQNWKLQLYFGTFTLNLDLYWKRWKLCEKKEKVWSEPVPKGCAQKKQKYPKQFVRFFRKKKFAWWKLNVIFMQSKKDNCWSDVCIAYEQILKMESCYPIQECVDRFSDRW